MAFVESQANPGTVQEIDPGQKAARSQWRPLDHTVGGRVLGHYSAFGQTAAAAFAAGANVAAFRYATDTNSIAIITRIYTCATVAAAITAQRTDPLVLFVARGYSVADATNATALAVVGNAQKMRSSNMGTSLSTNIAVSSAAAGVSGGTKTVDANAIGAAAFGAGGAVAALGTGLAVTDLYKADQLSRYPLTLGYQEGVLLQWGPTALATGTVTVGFGIDWIEVASF